MPVSEGIIVRGTNRAVPFSCWLVEMPMGHRKLTGPEALAYRAANARSMVTTARRTASFVSTDRA